jgi:formate hydrogenlyase subunit 4
MLAGQFIVAIGVGITESVIARLRMTRIPQFLIAASVIAAIGILVQFLGVA